MTNRTPYLEIAGCILGIAILLYIAIADCAWQFNNPKANNMTFWTHFNDVLHFRKLEKFQ